MAKFLGVVRPVPSRRITKKAYPMLYAFMSEFDRGLRFDDHTFLMEFDGTAAQLRAAIIRFVRPRDLVIVLQISDAAWRLDRERSDDLGFFML